MNHKVLLTGALLAGTIVLGGCANTSEIASLRTQVEQAQATADSAATSAAAASRDAAAAKALAEQAQADVQEDHVQITPRSALAGPSGPVGFRFSPAGKPPPGTRAPHARPH